MLSWLASASIAALVKAAKLALIMAPIMMPQAAAVATWTAAPSSATDGTSFTFNAVAIGTASADRVVVVGVSSGQTGTTTRTCTVTVGGVTATQIQFTRVGPTNSTHGGMYAVPFPSGTTANIVLTFSGTQSRCGIQVWALTGTNGVETPAFSAIVSSSGTAASVSTSVNTVAGGTCIGMFSDGTPGAANTTSWTNLTEDNDTVVELSVYSGAHTNGTTGSSLTVTATESASTSSMVLTLASW